MREHKCRKCKLSYKGFKSVCPYCHKKTKYGIMNTIMCVIGYITVIISIIAAMYIGITTITVSAYINSILFIPIIAMIIGIAIIVAFVIFMIK